MSVLSVSQHQIPAAAGTDVGIECCPCFAYIFKVLPSRNREGFPIFQDTLVNFGYGFRRQRGLGAKKAERIGQGVGRVDIVALNMCDVPMYEHNKSVHRNIVAHDFLDKIGMCGILLDGRMTKLHTYLSCPKNRRLEA